MSQTEDRIKTVQAPAGAKLWARAGHSLRQPVQAALYISYALRRHAQEAPALLDLLDPLEEALKGLQVEVELLTEIARKTEIASRPLRLDAVLVRAIAEVQPFSAAQDTEVRVRPLRSITVSSDERLLSLAISGLIHNALRLRAEGPVVAGVRLHGDDVRLEINIRGPAMSEAQIDAAFITLADPRSGRPSGQPALGLGFIDHICRLLGHRLEIGSPSRRMQRVALVMRRA